MRTKADMANHSVFLLVESNGAMAADVPGTMIKTTAMITAASMFPLCRPHPCERGQSLIYSDYTKTVIKADKSAHDNRKPRYCLLSRGKNRA